MIVGSAGRHGSLGAGSVGPAAPPEDGETAVVGIGKELSSCGCMAAADSEGCMVASSGFGGEIGATGEDEERQQTRGQGSGRGASAPVAAGGSVVHRLHATCPSAPTISGHANRDGDGSPLIWTGARDPHRPARGSVRCRPRREGARADRPERPTNRRGAGPGRDLRPSVLGRRPRHRCAGRADQVETAATRNRRRRGLDRGRAGGCHDGHRPGCSRQGHCGVGRRRADRRAPGVPRVRRRPAGAPLDPARDRHARRTARTRAGGGRPRHRGARSAGSFRRDGDHGGPHGARRRARDRRAARPAAGLTTSSC